MPGTRPAPVSRPCPCGGGAYAVCCEPLHDGVDQASTAEALMRSRYSAYALGLGDHVWRTWHPRTRPDDAGDLAGDVAWSGLEIVDVVAGGPLDEAGIVEFVAHHEAGSLHERSRFARRAGRWFYVDAED